MEAEEVPVVVVGAGPVGLSLALALARHGVRSVVLEKEPALRPYSRALGVLTRTLEIFRCWGVLDAFLAEGELKSTVPIYPAGKATPAAVVLDFNRLAGRTATPGLLILSQDRTEAILLRSVRETGLADVRFGHEVTGFREEGTREAGGYPPEAAAGIVVQVAARGGEEYTVRGAYLAGCDGAHSVVREQLGWRLEGKTYPTRVALADVRLTDERDALPWPRGAAGARGVLGAVRFEPEHWRIISTVSPGEPDEAVISPPALAAKVERLFGPGPFETLWASVFRIHCRTSPHFGQGRVILAGDAAHINSPAGGQGMNSGIEDTHNLAWKLARRLEGGSEALLISYEQERRAAVLTNVDQYTDFLTRAILLSHPLLRALFLRLGQAAVALPFVREQLAIRAGMLDTSYRHSVLIRGEGRWLGRRAPDGDLIGPDGRKLRLLDLAAREAALLLFDDGRLPCWNQSEIEAALAHVPHLRVARITDQDTPRRCGYRDADGTVWHGWRLGRGHPRSQSWGGNTAALVRPDGFVGWMAQRPSVADLRAGIDGALGVGGAKEP